MTEAEIQSFLDAQIGACKNSYCLNVYTLDTTWTDAQGNTQTTTKFDFGTCAPYEGAKSESAARVIFKVQQACGISAKVLLVTLQKEQGLVTDDAPSLSELRKALGQGCPDTADCDTAYAGFFYQVYSAARQLTWYSNPSGSFTWYPIGKTSQIRYFPAPKAGAGPDLCPETSGVTIANKATAALYYYTPYQPNTASLAAGWLATTAKCASYGNRNFWLYYNKWFGDPTSAGSPSAARIAGDDRFSTAVAVSRSAYPSSGVKVVYIATGLDFPDALSAAPAAAAQGGPILLVRPDSLPDATGSEIRRLAPGKIVVVGGEAAVNSAVFETLRGIQSNIQRISGADRYDTSRLVAASAFPSATKAYVATGFDFPDALSASAAAGSQGIPVILFDKAPTLAPAVVAALSKISSVKIAGGFNAVSQQQEAGLRTLGKSTARFAGADRYETGVLINKDAFPSVNRVYVATAFAFPDALAGAVMAGAGNSPLYVTQPGCMPSVVRADITSRNAQSMVLLGGPNAVSDNVARLAVC